MGSVINRFLISAHFSINTYFLTVRTYKCMHLTTQVYSITVQLYLNLDNPYPYLKFGAYRLREKM